MRDYAILLLILLSVNVSAVDDSDVAGNIGKVALIHVIIMEDYNGVPQLLLTQSATRNAVRYLKDEVDKTRPDGSNDNSFPSGHTGRAFSAAWFIQERYGFAHSWPYFASATWVGQQRVEKDRHYTEDVLASVLISYTMAKVFTSSRDSAPMVGLWYNEGLHVSIVKEF